MDDKFTALAELIREAKAEDKRTLAELDAATTLWKAANKTLTERVSVLNAYVAGLVNEHTSL